MTRQEASRRVQEAVGRFCTEPPPAALHDHTIDHHAKAVLNRLGALGKPSERLTAAEAIVSALPEDAWPVLFADCIIAEHRARHHPEWVKAAQLVSAQAVEAHKHLKAITRYLNRPRHLQEWWGPLSKKARDDLPMMDVTDAGVDPVADALHIVRSAIASKHRLADEHLQLVSRKTTPEAARAEGIGWIRESLIKGCHRAGWRLEPAWIAAIASAALDMGEITPDSAKQAPLYSDRLARLR